MFLLHTLTLPTDLKAQSFEQFGRDRLVEAVTRHPTRLGGAERVRLARRIAAGEDAEAGRQFLLLSDWSGLATTLLPRIGDPAVERLFEAFDVRVDPLGCFEFVADAGGR